MAALQALAIPLVLSARLRLALHPHAASGCLLALDGRKTENPAECELRGVFSWAGRDPLRGSGDLEGLHGAVVGCDLDLQVGMDRFGHEAVQAVLGGLP